MTTDDDRIFCRDFATRVCQNHLTNGGGGADAIQPGNWPHADTSYEETLYRGLMAECAFVNDFQGVTVNSALFSYGDGGRDFTLMLRLADEVRPFTLNVKATTVKRNWQGLRPTTYLRVPVSKCQPRTIYVFGVYLEPTDDAEVLAWDWGRTLIRENERRQFDGPWNYVRLFDDLRGLEELKHRMVIWEGLNER